MIDEYTKSSSESSEYERQRSRTPIPYDDFQKRQEIIDARQTYHEKKTVWRSYHLIWFFVGFIVALLGFRFVFELLGANPYNPFVQLIYTLSFPFAQPFESIFGITSVQQATFDWSILVAIIVYLLIGYALVKLLRIIHPVTTTHETNHRIRTV